MVGGHFILFLLYREVDNCLCRYPFEVVVDNVTTIVESLLCIAKLFFEFFPEVQ